MQIVPVYSATVLSKGANFVKEQVNSNLMAKPLSDELVLGTLKDELSSKMPEQDIQKWVNQVVSICKNLGIAITKLPINKDLPGSLTKEESHKFVTALFTKVL